ncbi:MAG: hypothetical protein R2706_04525 [Acidimicrobiales bacterium]
MSNPKVAGISGNPSDEEAAAIVAAIELAWPRPAQNERVMPASAPAWRFSGRWWAKPAAAIRQRP